MSSDYLPHSPIIFLNNQLLWIFVARSFQCCWSRGGGAFRDSGKTGSLAVPAALCTGNPQTGCTSAPPGHGGPELTHFPDARSLAASTCSELLGRRLGLLYWGAQLCSTAKGSRFGGGSGEESWDLPRASLALAEWSKPTERDSPLVHWAGSQGGSECPKGLPPFHQWRTPRGDGAGRARLTRRPAVEVVGPPDAQNPEGRPSHLPPLTHVLKVQLSQQSCVLWRTLGP